MAKTQAKLISNKSNILYLSNFTGSAGFLLVTKNKTYLFTDSRYVLRAQSSLKKGIELVDITRVWRNKKELQEHWTAILAKHRVKTLGVEENDLTVTKYKWFKKISKVKGKQVKLIDISGELEKEREVKTKTELKLITKSQRINEKVFKQIRKTVQDFQTGKTRSSIREIDLANKIRELATKYGAEDLSFDPIVGFGKNSASVHHNPGTTKLKRKDLVLIDMGVKYQGYCSDMSRTLLPPNPSAKMQEIYDTVLEAQKAGCKGIKAGISGAAADKLSRDLIEKAGYGEYYSHSGGHGIGLDIHERPNLASKFTGKLKENSVITIEPGIYLPGKFGVRIEDMVIVTKKGNKNLTKVKK